MTSESTPGRHGVADVSRLCRAILTEWTTADDPMTSPLIRELFEEARTKYPGKSLLMMASTVIVLARRLEAARARSGVTAAKLLADMRRHRKALGDTPALIDACMDIVDTAALDERDQVKLDRQIKHAAELSGSYSLAALTSIALKFATDVVTYSQGRYGDELDVFRELFAQDEQELFRLGES